MAILTFEEKLNTMEENLKEVFKKLGIVEWTMFDYNNGNFRMVAYTKEGEYSLLYDFDLTFDENLQTFYKCLVEYC